MAPTGWRCSEVVAMFVQPHSLFNRSVFYLFGCAGSLSWHVGSSSPASPPPPPRGSDPGPCCWERGVLATGSPGKSLNHPSHYCCIMLPFVSIVTGMGLPSSPTPLPPSVSLRLPPHPHPAPSPDSCSCLPPPCSQALVIAPQPLCAESGVLHCPGRQE